LGKKRGRPEFSNQGSDEKKMSKSDEESKSWNRGKQGNLFKDETGAGQKETGGTSRKAHRAELLSRLAEQRTLTSELVLNL